MTSHDVLSRLPEVRGRLEADVALAEVTWFRVGGPADVIFQPADEDDLAQFLKGTPADIPVTVIGVGSNLIVRDGGVRGVVVKLGKPFAGVSVEDGWRVRAGAAARDTAVAKAARDASVAGLEFFIGVPGAVGGSVVMNAGAYGGEVKDVFVGARGFTRDGEAVTFTLDDMKYAYRHSETPGDVILTQALFQGRAGERDEIAARLIEITRTREASQPIKERTGGSTFKNPDPDASGGRKAWQLIEAAGARGRIKGGAQVSERHCNFLINRGAATAADIEALGESLRTDVKAETGVDLEWEIRRIGEPG